MLQRMLGFDPTEIKGFIETLIGNANQVVGEQVRIREFLNLIAQHQLRLDAKLTRVMKELGIEEGGANDEQQTVSVHRLDHDGGEHRPAGDTETSGLGGTAGDSGKSATG